MVLRYQLGIFSGKTGLSWFCASFLRGVQFAVDTTS